MMYCGNFVLSLYSLICWVIPFKFCHVRFISLVDEVDVISRLTLKRWQFRYCVLWDSKLGQLGFNNRVFPPSNGKTHDSVSSCNLS